jgi:hypothetical protein
MGEARNAAALARGGAHVPKRERERSCVVVPIEMPAIPVHESKLSKNQQTMFSILHAAGANE